MKLFLHEDKKLKETIIDITYNVLDRRIQEVVNIIENRTVQLKGDRKNKSYMIDSYDIYYIESVDNLTFLYTKENVYENNQKLYSLEDKLLKTSFLRINKSTIINMDYLKNVSPLENYRLEAELKNGDRLIISRHYMKRVKEYLNI